MTIPDSKKHAIGLIGGTGYLGSAFRQQFRNNFSMIVNFGRTDHADIPDDEMYYNISKLSVAELAETFAGHNLTSIIDFAYNSVPKTSFEHPIADFSENLMLVNKHLEAVKMAGGITYIYISSGGTVYGAAAHTPIDEHHQNFPLSPYGITKMASERYVNMYHHLFEMPVKIVRPSNIYGPGQQPFKGQGLIPTALASMLTSKSISVFGDGGHIRDYLYVSDFCTALYDVLIYGRSGEVYNIGSSEGYSIREILHFVETNAYSADQRLQINSLPDRRFDVQYNVLNTKKVRELNGFHREVEIEEGIAKTADWIKSYLATN